MSEYNMPPISTLIGSNWSNYFKVLRSGGHIDQEYYLKLVLTTLIVTLSGPLRFYDDLIFNHKVREFKFEKEPLFILGHWRSGTTFLHNLLCQDDIAGYFTTYHAVFPNNLTTDFIYKRLMKSGMPSKRPGDNMKLDIDFPQEEEFAVGNILDTSFYNFFFFPMKYKQYYQKAVEDVNNGLVPEWDQVYRKMIIKALLYSKGQRAIIKNPVNTARIKSILRIFPNAKFIFLYRNPITVFLSTRNFFRKILPSTWFHKVDESFIDDMISLNYRNFIKVYYEQRELIKEDNLMEIRYEDLIANSNQHCKTIYTELLRTDFNVVEPQIRGYLKSQKDYVKNTYRISSELIDKINFEMKDHMKKWNYDIPDDIILT